MGQLQPIPQLKALESSAKKEADNLVFRALDYLNRPHSAISGFLAEGFSGRDPLAGAVEGFTEGEFSGIDVTRALGLDNQVAGAAFDFLNPLDPLNFVGIGGLTKAGRGARLLTRAAKAGIVDESLGLGSTLAEQAARGQRGLINFAGRPIVKARPVFELADLVGKKYRQSAPGKAITRTFGGRFGPARALGFDDDRAEAVFNAERRSGEASRLFEAQSNKLLDRIEKLSSGDDIALNDFLDRVLKGDEQFREGALRFIGQGKGADKRRAAVEAVEELMPQIKQATSRLEGTGLDMFFSGDPNRPFRPRVIIPTANIKKQQVDDIIGTTLTGDLVLLEGQSKNAMNQSLVQRSIQPVTVHTLDDPGRRLFEDMGGTEGFAKLSGDEQAQFLEKHRLTTEQLEALLTPLGFKVERRASKVLRELQRQVMANVETDEMVRHLEKAELAVPYSRELHAGDDWVRIDQGRWKNTPLAVPKDVDRQIQEVMDSLAPSAGTPLLGAFLAEAFPDKFTHGELLRWWKISAIFGGTPTAYWGRNITTGFIKNAVEGLNTFTPGSTNQTFRMYRTSVPIIGKMMRETFTPNDTVELGGVVYDVERLWQEYVMKRMHGGGLPDTDIVKSGAGRSAELRTKLLKRLGFTDATFASEMTIRLPLMFKYIEDTNNALRAQGVKLPARVRAIADDTLDEAAELSERALGEYQATRLTRNVNLTPSIPSGENAVDAIEVGFENAREAVLRAHFDYDDLSPRERAIRANWIPFYTWMRKNIPAETRNMIQEFGKYMPFVRAYYNSFNVQDKTPDDLPEWAAKSFAVPMQDSESGNVRFVDFSGFFPFMDIVTLADAVFGTPRPGGSRTTEVLRFAGSNFNPFITQAAEQALQRNLFTGREFSGDFPQEVFGQQVGGDVANAFNLFRPARDIDRLATPFFLDERRENRNEVSNPALRTFRFFTGIRPFEADESFVDLSKNQRKRLAARLKGAARRARREGDDERAEFLEARAERVKRAAGA